jgi:hypothetical protein
VHSVIEPGISLLQSVGPPAGGAGPRRRARILYQQRVVKIPDLDLRVEVVVAALELDRELVTVEQRDPEVIHVGSPQELLELHPLREHDQVVRFAGQHLELQRVEVRLVAAEFIHLGRVRAGEHRLEFVHDAAGRQRGGNASAIAPVVE